MIIILLFLSRGWQEIMKGDNFCLAKAKLNQWYWKYTYGQMKLYQHARRQAWDICVFEFVGVNRECYNRVFRNF